MIKLRMMRVRSSIIQPRFFVYLAASIYSFTLFIVFSSFHLGRLVDVNPPSHHFPFSV